MPEPLSSDRLKSPSFWLSGRESDSDIASPSFCGGGVYGCRTLGGLRSLVSSSLGPDIGVGGRATAAISTQCGSREESQTYLAGS